MKADGHSLEDDLQLAAAWRMNRNLLNRNLPMLRCLSGKSQMLVAVSRCAIVAILVIILHIALILAVSRGEMSGAGDALSLQKSIAVITVRLRQAEGNATVLAPATVLTPMPSASGRALERATVSRRAVAGHDAGSSKAAMPSLPLPLPLPPRREAGTGFRDDRSVEVDRVLSLSDQALYLRADELTQKPELMQDIAYDRLPVLPDVLPMVVSLRLFINEQGNIDQVVVEGSAVSKPAKEFMNKIFSEVKFQPGKVDDRFVKSQLAIEVTLGNNMAPAPAKQVLKS